MTSKFGVKDKKKRSYQDSQKEFDTTLLSLYISMCGYRRYTLRSITPIGLQVHAADGAATAADGAATGVIQIGERLVPS